MASMVLGTNGDEIWIGLRIVVSVNMDETVLVVFFGVVGDAINTPRRSIRRKDYKQ